MQGPLKDKICLPIEAGCRIRRKDTQCSNITPARDKENGTTNGSSAPVVTIQKAPADAERLDVTEPNSAGGSGSDPDAGGVCN